MRARILSSSDSDVAIAANALRQGQLVAMPTETVYGLAGDAFNEQAVAAIFAAKERPTFDPLICHIPRASGSWISHLQQQRLVATELLSAAARQAVEQLGATFWPGPLTLVLPRQANVPDLVTSGLPTVGVRCPRHEVAQRLLSEVSAPLAAPSANRFGRISPTAASHVMAELGDRIPFIMDGGDCDIGIESTVLLVEPHGNLVLLRPGAITAAQIEQATGLPVKSSAVTASFETPVPAPGMLASHYAPRKPLHLFQPPLSMWSDRDKLAWQSHLATTHVGVLRMSATPMLPEHPRQRQVFLSRSGDAAEAARSLFAAMRALDDDPVIEEIWAELHPDTQGLAFAINDRLTKASHP